MAIVRKDKVLSGYNGNLESVVHTKEMTNGLFTVLGKKVADSREVHEVVVPTAENIATEEVLLIHAPEVMYDERKYRLRDFRIPANQPARAYRMSKGDVITLTKDLFVGAVKVGDEVTPAVDGSMKLTKAGKEAKSTLVFEVIEEDSLDVIDGEALVLKVKRA